MTSFKLTVSDTKGKSLTKELKDAEATPLLGLEVGAEADATIVGFEGKIKITGGSDKSDALCIIIPWRRLNKILSNFIVGILHPMYTNCFEAINVNRCILLYAGLVQPGRTSASQAEGRVFKSRTPHLFQINNRFSYRIFI